MVRGIVFDLFDTLVDQNHDRLAPVMVEGRKLGATTPGLHAEARDQFGIDLSILEFADRLRSTDQELRIDTIDQGIELSTLDRFIAFGLRLGLADAAGNGTDLVAFGEALTSVHMGALYAACTTPPHHEAVLMALSVNHKMGLCSNFSHAETARAILRDAEFDQHLDTIVISEEMGIRKPRPEIFEKVINDLGFAPDEILHVGDNLRADVEGAAAVGMRTVWITRQVKDPEAQMAAYDGPGPDFALENLMDLPVLAARLAV